MPSMSRKARAAAYLAAVLWLAAGCTALFGPPPAIEVTLVNFIPQEVALLEQKLQVEVQIINPNNRALTLTGLKFDLSVNGKPLLRAMSPLRTEIPPLSDAVVRVGGSVTTVSLLRQILEFQEGSSVSYRLHGFAYTDRFPEGIPFEESGRFSPGK